MHIIEDAIAGTLESSDAMVKVSPNPSGGLDVIIESAVQAQFGAHISALVDRVLHDLGVTDALVTVDDKGALDCVLAARVQAAVLRGAGDASSPTWSALSVPGVAS